MESSDTPRRLIALYCQKHHLTLRQFDRLAEDREVCMGDLIGCFEVSMTDAAHQLGGLAQWVFQDRFEDQNAAAAELEALQYEIDDGAEDARVIEIKERMIDLGKKLARKRR